MSIASHLIPCRDYKLVIPNVAINSVLAYGGEAERDTSKAKWSMSPVTWQGAELPIVDLACLMFKEDHVSEGEGSIIVMNPIPGSVRKSFAGLFVEGDVLQLDIQDSISDIAMPDNIDRRYVQSACAIGDTQALMPNLDAFGVLLSYL